MPPICFAPAPTGDLLVRWVGPDLAIETRIPGRADPGEVQVLPLEALDQFEGRDATAVQIDSEEPGQVRVRWEDRGVPRTALHTVLPTTAHDFPETPAHGQFMTGPVLAALAEACRITSEESARFALGCVLLRGRAGEVVATDGRQLLYQRVGRWTWDEDLLLPRSPIFGCKALSDVRPVWVGRTATAVIFRAGDWTIVRSIAADARYPDVESVLRLRRRATTVLRLDDQDAAVLGPALARLPGVSLPNAPATLECNGKIAVRVESDSGPPSEVVLSRSSYQGRPIQLGSDRQMLRRVLDLGLRQLHLGEPNEPAFAVDGDERVFAWQPLTTDQPATSSPPAAPVDPGVKPPSSETSEPPRQPMNEIPNRNGTSTREERPKGAPAVTAEGTAGSGMVELIREAEAIATALMELRTRQTRIVTALRRQRRQDRLVRETLRSLRQLHLAEVPE